VVTNCIGVFLSQAPSSVNRRRHASRQLPAHASRTSRDRPTAPSGRGRTVLTQARSAKRHKWRLPCEIVYEGGRQRSFVLDLSATGLFVQTGVRLKPGAEIEVRLSLESVPQPLVLRARVARAKQVPQQLMSVAQGGVGLRLLSPPRSYLDALRNFEEGSVLRAGSDVDPASPPPPALRFRVRVKQSDGPRMRAVQIQASSPESARTLALREVGAGWEIVAVEPAA